MDKNLRLGRGLSALMGEDEENNILQKTTKEKNDILLVNINKLVPSSYQPRRVFTTEALADLVVSIKEKGVLQPLLVRCNPKKENSYEIIAGERRFRASKMAGLQYIPVIVKDFNDKDVLEVALIENLQRENLNPIEEAEAYKRLLKEFKYTQDGLSKVVGKSRSYLANMMRLLELPDEIKNMVEKKELTIGHARALLTATDPILLAHSIIKKGYSVRQTEKMAARKNNLEIKKTIQKEHFQKDNDIIALEKELSIILKTHVSIKWNGRMGEIVISCQNLDKLDLILQRLSVGGPIE